MFFISLAGALIKSPCAYATWCGSDLNPSQSIPGKAGSSARLHQWWQHLESKIAETPKSKCVLPTVEQESQEDSKMTVCLQLRFQGKFSEREKGREAGAVGTAEEDCGRCSGLHLLLVFYILSVCRAVVPGLLHRGQADTGTLWQWPFIGE